ncbi:Threonine/homoserine efflux transporter RhtA [Yoonia tamlensis]|uniref:Threonine/homoserine efflux transporter RhtA n=2 Tax=Yoonia tamlensis TaxID=390270 RepID=A0A1I6FWU0_9RHOB|nr:Threonine/homoserine efflux transporter RhtA [Yoonia tamlensis]
MIFREKSLQPHLAFARPSCDPSVMDKQKQSRPLAGVGWMVFTGLMFVGVTAVVKHVGDDVPAAEAAFLRYLLGIVFLVPMIKPILDAHLTRRQLNLFALRGVVHTLAVILWFFAMARIPIAEVTAMNYLSPVYVSIGAALFLGERLPPRRLVAVIVALIGALIILRPGVKEIEPGHIAMLGTAVFFAIGYLIAKQLSGEVSAAVVVGMLSVTVTIGLAPAAMAVWVTPTLTQLGWLFLVACFATAGHYAMTLAFAAAPLTVTQPVTFLQLVWAVLLGAVVFGEAVDGWVVFGGAVIMASVSFITWREAVARRHVTPPVPATKV